MPSNPATGAAMTAERARHLLAEYAVLVAHGCPVGTELGIDLQTYRIDERFRGIKMIPPGPHYVYTASRGAYGDTDATRVGFMHFFKPREIVVRQWCEAAEELHERHRTGDAPQTAAEAAAAAAEAERIRDNLMQLDGFLAPFDQTTSNEWHLLTQFITASRLERTLPTGGIIRAAAEHESCPDAERPRGINNSSSSGANASRTAATAASDAATKAANNGCSSSSSSPITTPAAASIDAIQTRRRRLANRMHQQPDASDLVLLPALKLVASTAMRFTELPARCPADATPGQVTDAFMDCYAAVEQLVVGALGADRRPLRLIDECQLAFVCFATGGSMDALAHWRRQLHLLAHSERAVHRWPLLYAAYVRCLCEQLPHLPAEMRPPSEFNTVYRDCEQLVRNCGTLMVSAATVASVDGAEVLGDALEMLVARARGELEWEFAGAELGEEDPDDAPVVVDMEDGCIL